MRVTIDGSHKFGIDKKADKRMSNCNHEGEDLVIYRDYIPSLIYCLQCEWFKQRPDEL